MQQQKSLLFVFFTLLGTSLFAQYRANKDAGLWSTLTIQHEIKDNLILTLDQEFRMRENYTQINLFYTNLGVAYKINKNWKIEPSIRHIDKFRADGTVSFRNRFSLDINFKTKFKIITFTQRARYQTEFQDYYSSKKGKLNEQFLRYKLNAEYNTKGKLTPYLAVELRYQISVPGKDAQFNGLWHRIRYIGGLEYKLNKKNIVNLYYVIQNEFNISPPEDNFITGISYTFKI